LLFVLIVLNSFTYGSFAFQSYLKPCSSSTNSSASQVTCASEGDSCMGDLIKPNNCSGSSCCSFGLYCFNQMCATDNMGSACNTTEQCFPAATTVFYSDQPYACVNKSCQYLSLPNDYCNVNSDCLSGLSCSEKGICVGKSLGDDCTIGQCGYNLTCALNVTTKTGVCQQALLNNTSCNTVGDYDFCEPGSTCTNGVCTTDFSLGLGANCSGPKKTRNLPCQVGFTCDTSNNTCIDAVISLPSCSENSDCSGSSTCQCSTFTNEGVCLPTESFDPCAMFRSELYQCMIGYKCLLATDAPNSCCYDKCSSDFKQAFLCQCSTQSTIFGNCSYNPYCRAFPIWGILLIILGILVLLYFILIIVLFIVKKPRKYDEI